jgi:hypothetical protein
MNLSLSEATEFVKAKTPGLKRFIPKFFCYHIHEKSMYLFTETIRLFVCFLPVFSSFRTLMFFIFQLFNFCLTNLRSVQLCIFKARLTKI